VVFLRSKVLYKHKGPTFRASHSEAVVDSAWQAITSWVRSNKSRLQNSVHRLLPYGKKDQFKAYGVKKDVPIGDGAPLGCDGGDKLLPTGCSAQD
jgi:hypothetical protein